MSLRALFAATSGHVPASPDTAPLEASGLVERTGHTLSGQPAVALTSAGRAALEAEPEAAQPSAPDVPVAKRRRAR